jgi:RHS repeat-associated protein
VGNILTILDQVNPAENRTHTYDALQRLTTGGTTGTAETYDYDLVGNRTTSFLSFSHTHDDLNRLLEDDQFLYTYDDNGNLETKTEKATSDVTTYQWDAQDQLIQIDRPDATTVTYKYDGLGRRIEKDVAGSSTRYVYDGQDILLEYDGTNTFVARYNHGGQVDQPLVLQKGGVGFFYYHSNHQGSITHLTDSSGTIANSYVYDSYGRRLNVAESVLQPYSYTGREYDVESGLYFSRARYFDANTGRFLTKDPLRLRAGDQNFYRYVRNNPLNLNDPFGFFPPSLVPDFVIENTQNVVNNVTGGAFTDEELEVLTDLVIEGIDIFSTQGGLGDALELGSVNPFVTPTVLTPDQFQALEEIIQNVNNLDLTSSQRDLVNRANQEFKKAEDKGKVKVSDPNFQDAPPC